MRDIAQALGMRQASLYYHAPDGKEQLFVDVARRSFQQHGQGLQAAIDEAGPDLEAQLLAAADWFASQPSMNLLGMMHADMPVLSQANADLLSEEAFRSLFQPLMQAFAAARARDEIRLLQPDLLAGVFLALMDGMAYASESQPKAPPKKVMARIMVSILLDGLRPGSKLDVEHSRNGKVPFPSQVRQLHLVA
jgi:AcrR family transcriptional regulator